MSKRRSSIINFQRIDDVYKDINYKSNFVLLYGDLTDASSILNLIKKVNPDEIYNLAAQSHVGFLLRSLNIVLMLMVLEL